MTRPAHRSRGGVIVDAMAQQGYDPDPPRCFTCVYFQRKSVRVSRRPNHVTEKCTFGNFTVTVRGVCDEWRSRAGEKLEPTNDHD